MVTETANAASAPAPQPSSASKSKMEQASGKKPPRNLKGFPRVSPEIMKRIEKRFLKIPEVRAEFEKRARKDSDFKNNSEKKMEFFREMREKYPDKFRRRN